MIPLSFFFLIDQWCIGECIFFLPPPLKLIWFLPDIGYSFTMNGLLHFNACGDLLLCWFFKFFFQEASSFKSHHLSFSLCVVTSSWFEAVVLLSQWSVCADSTLLIIRALNAKPCVYCMSINLSQEGSSHSPQRHVCVNFENHVVVRRLCTALTQGGKRFSVELFLWFNLTNEHLHYPRGC